MKVRQTLPIQEVQEFWSLPRIREPGLSQSISTPNIKCLLIFPSFYLFIQNLSNKITLSNNITADCLLLHKNIIAAA